MKYGFLLSSIFLFFSLNGNKIAIVGIYTDSHKILFEEWFKPTLQDDFEIKFVHREQECPSGDFYKEGWTQTTLRKVELWIEAVQENWGEIIICSDVDIQFFRPVQDIILDCIKGFDIVLQRDHPYGEICTGFFACRANAKILKLFQDVRDGMISGEFKCDQRAINRKLRDQAHLYGIMWDYLPSQFFGAGTLTGQEWDPKKGLELPKGILLHHANFTVGVQNKIKQLQYVREKVLDKNS